MSRRQPLTRDQILELLDLDDPAADNSFVPGESDESSDSGEESVPVTEPVPSTSRGARKSRCASRNRTRGARGRGSGE